MIKNAWKSGGLSGKLSQICALLSLLTLVVYAIYGVVCLYFDLVVCLTLALGVVCAQGYVLCKGKWGGLLNLLSVACLSFGVGLFFLNSYPVWADWYGGFTMYGSRGGLFPVVAIMVLVFVCALVEIVSCFTSKGKDVEE